MCSDADAVSRVLPRPYGQSQRLTVPAPPPAEGTRESPLRVSLLAQGPGPGNLSHNHSYRQVGIKIV